VWSRRLTQEHRVVYLVRHDRIDFLQGLPLLIPRSSDPAASFGKPRLTLVGEDGNAFAILGRARQSRAAGCQVPPGVQQITKCLR
jgi:hypothetical protein